MTSDCPPLIVLRAYVAHAAAEYDKSTKRSSTLSAIRTVKCKHSSVANGEVQIDPRYASSTRDGDSWDVVCPDPNNEGETLSFNYRLEDGNGASLFRYMESKGLDFDKSIVVYNKTMK